MVRLNRISLGPVSWRHPVAGGRALLHKLRLRTRPQGHGLGVIRSSAFTSQPRLGGALRRNMVMRTT